ncbi:MAG: hypothetical protein WBA93_14830 [Microcoleaceae cyanobacterium]
MFKKAPYLLRPEADYIMRNPTRRTNVYRLNPGSKWKHPKKLEDLRQWAKSPKVSKSQQKNEQVSESDSLESEDISENNLLAEEGLFPDPWQ